MGNNQPKIYIGFITYGEATAKYLPYFLPSLEAQTFQDYKIVAVDNSETENNANADYLKNNFSLVSLKWAGENLGFAKAFNLMIAQAIAAGAEYFLALNPDMTLEPDFLAKMVEMIRTEKGIGAVAPKILKWDFANNRKTNQIDSLGLAINREHRFFDAHQGEADEPGLAVSREVFGFTGAAVLLNLSALREVAFTDDHHQEYFDELMFMYKEDCDLSYRLRLAGWKIILAPEAVAYHNRAVAAKGKTNYQIAVNRRAKSRAVKEWSFLNQSILLLKLKKLPFSWRVKFAMAWYELKSLIFIMLFEQFLLKQLWQLWLWLSVIAERRKRMRVTVDIKAIEKFMQQ